MIFSTKNHSRTVIVLLGTILIVSAFVRFWHVGANPFVADEFLDVNATYGYYKTGQWQAWDFNRDAPSNRQNSASDQRAWLYRIQVASLYNQASFLPPTETTARLISVLWGIVMTVIIYVITYSFTRNSHIALIAAALWAMSVPAIEINRKIRMYSMFAPIFLLFSWSVFQFLERGRIKSTSLLAQLFNFHYGYLIPMLLLGALAFHLHPLAGNIVLVLFVYIMIRALSLGARGEVINRYSIYTVLMIIVVMLFAHFSPEQFTWFLGTVTFFENHWSYLGHILATYWHPLLGVLLIGCGSVVALRHQSPARLWIVVEFFVILLSAIFLWKRNVGPQYIFFVQAFGIMLAAEGIHALLKRIEQSSLHNGRIAAIIVLIILVPNYGYFFQKNNTYHITSSGESANYRKVFDYVKRNIAEGDVMITRNVRNYYFGGLGIKVFDFGSDRDADVLAEEEKVKKITAPYVKEIVAHYPSGWVVFSDNDEYFITKEAREYIDGTMKKINDSPLIRGKISVYKWPK